MLGLGLRFGDEQNTAWSLLFLVWYQGKQQISNPTERAMWGYQFLRLGRALRSEG